ncbi:Uncharacterized protein TCM_005666 [Theobroma cacao]|uniref:Uncharacterized protein n=1 Tax=Theobroma cacao TaxID=3641 RepID=A0A061E2A8_THECC|nr:Uncharacterized protein TCM_005666 [Theobroma cacao]
MQLGDSSQPIWVEFKPAFNQNDGLRVYFCTKNGLLLELSEVEPLRWENHGRPPGADVATIADVVTVRTEVVYTISFKPPVEGKVTEKDKAAGKGKSLERSESEATARERKGKKKMMGGIASGGKRYLGFWVIELQATGGGEGERGGESGRRREEFREKSDGGFQLVKHLLDRIELVRTTEEKEVKPGETAQGSKCKMG